MPKLHKLRTYKDGYKEIEYCCVCGAEDQELLLNCVEKIDDRPKKKVDEKKESA